MIFIAHRINTVQELSTIPSEYGVEVDLRDSGAHLVLNHDPFGTGEHFETFLKAYHHRTLILNIKSERIEHRTIELLKKYSVTDYFFLDSSFPMIRTLSEAGEKNIALRFSEFEGLDTIRAMQGRVSWVWVDCFTRLPLGPETYTVLKQAGFKICLASPELQSQPEKVPTYREQLNTMHITPDAICCKTVTIPLWK